MNVSYLTSDLAYLALFTFVLIFPKVLLRFKIPSGITALAIGVCVGSLDKTIQYDQLIRFLSQIGITSLFVFAGLEVNFKDLKNDRVYLSKYLLKSLVVILLITYGLKEYFTLSIQDSLIFALGIFTPSAGFIINSLHSYKMSGDQEYWIKSKAVSKEIIAILFLFIAMQSDSVQNLVLSLAYFTALLLFLPIIFKLFFKFVSPYAPNSEVPFLVMLSLVAGIISKELGAYYLVGAFAVGIIGSLFKREIFKEDEEALFNSLAIFFNVFLPFYFFYAGLKIYVNELTLRSFFLAIGLFVVFVPIRLGLIRMSIKYFMKDQKSDGHKISLSLMPNLIFGLVIAGILKERGQMSLDLIYALIIYTLLTSLLPSILISVKKIGGATSSSDDQH